MTLRRILPALIAGAGLAVSAAHGASVTLTASRDTSLFEKDPDANSGSYRLASGTVNSGERSRAVFAFDLAGQIPTGATIESVTVALSITRQSNNHRPSAYGIHRLLADWGEGSGSSDTIAAPPGDATWNSRLSGSAPWAAPGALAGTDYLPTLSGAGPVVDTGTGTYTIASTAALLADVQAWLATPTSNFGWILIGQSEATTATARRFAASDYTLDGGSGPQLTITYTVVPEPGTLLSLSGGTAILLGWFRIRSRPRARAVARL